VNDLETLHPSERRRMVVRFVFLAVAAFLVAQFAVSHLAEEPYPSFVYPSFPGAPDDSGPQRVLQPSIVVRFAEPDRTVELSYRQLLSPAPGVVADAIAYTALAPRPSSARPRTTGEQFRLFLKQPTFTRGARTVSAELRDPTTVAWLRNRLAQLYPGSSPRSLVIRWDERRYLIDDSSISETVTPVSRLRVPLEG
jgi:hypothetical protein